MALFNKSSFQANIVEQISYQVLQSGGWITIQAGSNSNAVEINNNLSNISSMYPGARVRAINQNGSIVDIR